MKINELIDNFEIYVSNEEKSLLETIDQPMPLASFSDREQVVINNLVRKSVISKVKHGSTILVMKNVF